MWGTRFRVGLARTLSSLSPSGSESRRYLSARYTGPEELALQGLGSGLACYSLPRSRLSCCYGPADGIP